MAFTAMTTPTANAPYSASDLYTILANLSFLNDQKATAFSGGDTSNAWTPAGAAWEDDPNLTLTATITATSLVVVVAHLRWKSNTVRTTSLQMRIKYGSSYTTSPGYWGAGVANNYYAATFFALLSGQTVGDLALKLSAYKNTAGDTITINDRYLYAICLPDGT